jgi:DNA-binding beta-propeller fold protein YncE
MVFAGSRIYILDNEALSGSPAQIIPFTVGTNGALNAAVGGAVADDPTEANPIYLLVESKGKFLYVANQQGASTSTGAGIAGYSISPQNSELSQDPGSPWGTGAEPQCLLEDPSNQFIYTANAGDSTITGRKLDPNSGSLKAFTGSNGTFALTGPATWCVATGRTN